MRVALIVAIPVFIAAFAITSFVAAGAPSDGNQPQPGATPRGHDQPQPVEIPPDVAPEQVGITGMRESNGQLTVFMLADGKTRRCWFDAAVALADGRVGTIVAEDVQSRIATGDDVTGLPADLALGRTISIPVHVENGMVNAGYSSCDEFPSE